MEAGTDQRKTVVVRPRGVEGDDSREKVREERESERELDRKK